jgi:hypothetical protein
MLSSTERGRLERTRFMIEWYNRLAQEKGQPSQRPIKCQFSASTAVVTAAGSGSDAMILRSMRRIPLRRRSLILAIASPRTKLPNSEKKPLLWRTARTQ